MSEVLPILSVVQVREWFAKLPTQDFVGKRVLLIVPDATRTAPLPLLFGALHSQLRPVVAALDVLVALGTHPPMSDAQIAKLLGIDEYVWGADSRVEIMLLTKCRSRRSKHAWFSRTRQTPNWPQPASV